MKIISANLLFLVMAATNLGCVQNSKDSINLIDFRNRQLIELQKPILIAHRGGVITEKTPECSLAAIRLAKQQGYAMVELDVQKSRDGIPIVLMSVLCKEKIFQLREVLGWIPYKSANSAPETRNGHNEFKRTC